jgi:hypothetical protein
MRRTYKVNKHVLETSVQSKVEWASLKFPPLNLWSIWPSKEMVAIHMEDLDKTLWDKYDEDE